MSRCFPFPPPGYERKHRLEDLILFKEAKHKEKKERKEKKDKDRKKDKEKKDKDRKKDKEKKEKDGSEKQRDKKDKHKDKKEKHGNKKKDEDDRRKYKEKTSISEESTIAGKLDERSGEKVHPEIHYKYGSVEDEGRYSTFFQGQNGKKPVQSVFPSQETKVARFVQELDRRIRDDHNGRGSQFPQRFADRESAAGTPLWNPSQVLAEEKHNDGDKSSQSKKLDLQRRNGEFVGKATVQTLTEAGKSKNEGNPRQLEEHNNSSLEDNEKYKHTGGDKQGDARKDTDKKNRGKDKHKEKEEKKKKKKKEVKSNVNTINDKSEPEKYKISGRNDLAGVACNGSVNVLKDIIDTAVNEGGIRKRKDIDTNGFLHEGEIRPNKVQMLALHQLTENGRKVEASCKSSSDMHAFPNNVRLDHHGRLSNGIIEAKKPSPSKPNPSGISMFCNQIVAPPKMLHPDFSSANASLRIPSKDHSAEASKRPPHPETNYLSQILTVPTVGDWPEDDDQEWLFSKKGPPKKTEAKPVGVTEELQGCPLRVVEERAVSGVDFPQHLALDMTWYEASTCDASPEEAG